MTDARTIMLVCRVVCTERSARNQILRRIIEYAAADRQRSMSSSGESSGLRGVAAGYLSNGKDGVLQRNAACHQCR